MTRASLDAPDEPDAPGSFQRRFWLGTVDARSVALFRIVIGACVVKALFDYAPDLVAWFSDDGVMPRATAFNAFDLSGSASILYAVGDPWHVAVVWYVALLAALAMTVGYRTRVATFTVFVFLVGFHERLPSICDGSDHVLRLSVFFLGFTASGAAYSIDSARAHAFSRRVSTRVDALPVRLLQLHVASIYLWSACFKLRGDRWLDGTAVRYALHLPHVVSRHWASSLGESRSFVGIATYATLAFELLFLFAVFSPVARVRTTRWAIAGGTLLHLGILATLNVGPFSYVMPLSYAIFLEGSWLAAIHARVGRVIERSATWIARQLPARVSAAADVPRRPAIVHAPLVFVALAIQWVAMPAQKGFVAPYPLANALSFGGLVPDWRMFAPNPVDTDYAMSAPAEYADGSRGDLLNSERRTTPRPDRLVYSRWIKFEESLAVGDEQIAEAWASWACRQKPSDPTHGDVVRFALVRRTQRVPAFGSEWAPPRSRTVLKRECRELRGRGA